MLTLAYPWLLLALPVPYLVRRLLPAHEEARAAVIIPQLAKLAQLTGSTPGQGASVLRQPAIRQLVGWLVWILIVGALVRPQWIGEPLTRTVPTRDLLLAVDLSGSMDTEDFTDEQGVLVDRLTAVKEILDGFLAERVGDRVGLIFFGSAAFVQAPFTDDLEVCRVLLDEAQVRMAGPQTVLGDAMGLAIHVFEESEVEQRVLILLTDGNDTASLVPPADAAVIARNQGITVHTVAVGDPGNAGEEKLDEETLKQIAATTGGGYFRANDRAELATVYERLDELETRQVDTISHRPTNELFFWPLGTMLVLSLLYHLVLELSFVRLARRAAQLAPLPLVLSLQAVDNPGFHFLRPAWLWLLLPATYLTLRLIRRQSSSGAARGLLDPHLLEHLISSPGANRGYRPHHLLAFVWGIGCLALAGPTWEREPSPFAEDTAALVIVVEVTPTMMATDVQPTRLERAQQKIRDLLALREGARTGLVAYAGSAHMVMPLTRDAGIIETFADALAPAIMPAPGDEAAAGLRLADERLQESGLGGSILLITDGIEASQQDALRKYQKGGGAPVHILAVAAPPDAPAPPRGPPAPPLDETALRKSADLLGGSLTVVTPDERDVQRLISRIESSFQAAPAEGGERWRDMGYWLVPLLAAVAVIWNRKGWVVRHA